MAAAADEICALILAAGGSARLGRPKQLEDWGGRPLLEHVVRLVEDWPVATITVVLGAAAEEILEAVDFGDATVVLNPEWQAGISSSLRVGLDALTRSPRAAGAFVVLGDQPAVPRSVVERLLAEYRAGTTQAVVPRYRYTRGNPVLFDRSLWARLMSLEGDQGARTLLQAHPEWVTEVWVDHLPPRDVDTESDVGELRPRT